MCVYICQCVLRGSNFVLFFPYFFIFFFCSIFFSIILGSFFCSSFFSYDICPFFLFLPKVGNRKQENNTIIQGGYGGEGKISHSRQKKYLCLEENLLDVPDEAFTSPASARENLTKWFTIKKLRFKCTFTASGVQKLMEKNKNWVRDSFNNLVENIAIQKVLQNIVDERWFNDPKSQWNRLPWTFIFDDVGNLLKQLDYDRLVGVKTYYFLNFRAPKSTVALYKTTGQK